MSFFANLKAQQAYKLHSKGQWQEARPLYEDAIAKGMNNPRYLLSYAILLIRLGEYQKAKDHLVKIQKHPGLTPEQKVQLFMDYAVCCYKLGDLYKHGTGCEANAAEAFRWYVCASELATRERPVILGSIALRLGGCYEDGFGCTQDFSRALAWYQKAVAGLEAAVEGGEVWYEKALAGARAGVKRCQQEV